MSEQLPDPQLVVNREMPEQGPETSRPAEWLQHVNEPQTMPKWQDCVSGRSKPVLPQFSSVLVGARTRPASGPRVLDRLQPRV